MTFRAPKPVMSFLSDRSAWACAFAVNATQAKTRAASERFSIGVSSFSKIRLFGGRQVGVLVGVIVPLIVVSDVFGADALLPCRALGAQISLGRRPGHGEDARILDPEFELQ